VINRSNIFSFSGKAIITLMIASIAALLSLSPGLRAQDSKIRVAMLEPVGNATAMQKAVIRGALAEAITNERGYEALTRTEIDNVMKEYDFQDGGMVSDAGRAELGRMFAAELLCITRLTREKDYFFVESSLIDMESGRMVKTATELIESTPAASLREGSIRLAAKLMSGVRRPNAAGGAGSGGNRAPATNRDAFEARESNIRVAMLEPWGNATAMQKAAIRGALAEAIANERGYEALTRTEIDNIMKEHDFQDGGMVSDAGRAELGRMTSAELLCTTRLTREKTYFFVESSLIDMESGRIVKTATELIESAPSASLREGSMRLAAKLMAGVRRPKAPGRVSTEGNRTFTVNGVTFEMVYAEGDGFNMGCTPEQGNECSDDEKPLHRVNLPDFYIGKYEVTQALWRAVMGANPSAVKGDNLPIESVSWDDSQTFIGRLNNLTGEQFRLPTEAEWEYAARGGNQSSGYKYSGGSDIYDVAWYGDNSDGRARNAGGKKANELGIYDMSGNVAEWCRDWYGANYYGGSAAGSPVGPSSGKLRVYRGGSWRLNAKYARVSSRGSGAPNARLNYLGLRLALSLE